MFGVHPWERINQMRKRFNGDGASKRIPGPRTHSHGSGLAAVGSTHEWKHIGRSYPRSEICISNRAPAEACGTYKSLASSEEILGGWGWGRTVRLRLEPSLSNPVMLLDCERERSMAPVNTHFYAYLVAAKIEHITWTH